MIGHQLCHLMCLSLRAKISPPPCLAKKIKLEPLQFKGNKVEFFDLPICTKLLIIVFFPFFFLSHQLFFCDRQKIVSNPSHFLSPSLSNRSSEVHPMWTYQPDSKPEYFVKGGSLGARNDFFGLITFGKTPLNYEYVKKKLVSIYISYFF